MDFKDTKSIVDLNLASRLVVTQGEMSACFQLRYGHFVKKLGWVADNLDLAGLERDGYDPHALHLGVWENDGLSAYLRVLPFDPEVGFMLDHELSAIMSEQDRIALPRENAVELSRFVCDICPPHKGDFHPVELLLKRLYQISLECNFQRFYIVVESGWLRPFKRRFGLPFRVLGQPHIFPDGTETVAAVATREELEAGMRSHSRAKYEWYLNGVTP